MTWSLVSEGWLRQCQAAVERMLRLITHTCHVSRGRGQQDGCCIAAIPDRNPQTAEKESRITSRRQAELELEAWPSWEEL